MAKPKLNDPQSWYEQDPNSPNQYRVIPGAGVYLQNQAKAQGAYERSKAQLMAQRAKQQISSGLGRDWQVDPRSQYGTYQSMLQNQGMELDQAQEAGQQRGFFGAGLGNQGDRMLRYGQAVQSLGFKNQISDWETDYQNQMADIERARHEAMLAELQSAADDAYNDEDYTEWVPPEQQAPNAVGPQYSGPRVKPAPIYGRPTPPINKRPRTKPNQFGSRGWVHVPGGRY